MRTKKTRKQIIAHYHKRINNPENYWLSVSSTIVGMAIRHGHLVRPDKCSKCGIKKGTTVDKYGRKIRIESHHHNYNFPLRVVWLCQFCHRKKHNKNYKTIKYNF